MIELLFAILLLNDMDQCQVRGYVTGLIQTNAQTDKAELTYEVDLETNCPITVHLRENVIEMKSPRWKVEFTIPANAGVNVPFWYRWGQKHAWLGTVEMPILYGPANGA